MQPRTAGTGWAFTSAITLVMGVSVFMVPTLGVLGPFIVEHDELTRTHIGLLASLIPLSGAACSATAGALADRFGGRRLAAMLLGASASALVILAASPSFAWMVVGACVAGVAFAMGNPATNHLIATHAPPGRQGVIVGVKQSGVQIASFAAGAALPGLAVVAGWRVAALSAASVGLVTLGLLFGVVPRDRSGGDGHDAPRQDGADRPRWPAIRFIAGYAFFMGACTAATVTYLPLYAYERLGLTVTAAGAAAGLMAGVAVFTRVGWARVAERTWTASRTLLVIAALTVVSQIVVISAVTVPALVWAAAVGLGTSAVAWNGVAMLFVVRGAPPGLSGRFTGHVQLAFSLGMFSSPLAFGYLVDRTGSYAPGWSAAACCAVLASACIIAGRRTLEPVRSRATSDPV